MHKCCGTCKHGGRITAVRKSSSCRYAEAAAVTCELGNCPAPITDVCPKWEANHKNI